MAGIHSSFYTDPWEGWSTEGNALSTLCFLCRQVTPLLLVINRLLLWKAILA